MFDNPQPPIQDLLRSNQAFESRVRELEASNAGLRREVALEGHRLQALLRELRLAAERVGDWPLARAIRAVAAVPSDLSPLAACGLGGRRLCDPVPALSTREREVLGLLTEGSRSPDIAVRLGISSATVEVHRRNIMRKLGLHTVAALTKYAVREGLTSL